ncbi:MAG TPA: ROK family protein, partial [Candidatus Paenibacillus intestinavium]|nr:ROK family protein [Candidatus Paenibacillus intestinavium]
MDANHPTLSSVKSSIFHYIAQRIDTSKEDIQQSLKLSSSTAARLIQEMIEHGVIIQSGLGPSKGGRRPLLYNINSHCCYIVGIEISRFYATVGLFDLALNAKSLTRWRMDSSMKPAVFIDTVYQTIVTYCKDHQITKNHIIGIGIGSIGPLDRSSGVIIDPVHFPAEGWNQLEITTLIEEITGLTTFLDNGIDCAAIGEQFSFRKQNIEADHLLYISAGVGLRSAMISGGRLVQGIYDREGAFGEMIIKAGDQPILKQGRAGALENYVSIPTLVEQYKIEYRLGRTGFKHEEQPNIAESNIDFDFLIRELRNNNELVTELFNQSAVYLGIGIANLINTFQPNKVIIGGALISAFKPYSDIVESIADKYTYNSSAYKVQFIEGILLE